MKEIVSRILDVIMYLIPFFGKRKRDRVVRENDGKGKGT